MKYIYFFLCCCFDLHYIVLVSRHALLVKTDDGTTGGYISCFESFRRVN